MKGDVVVTRVPLDIIRRMYVIIMSADELQEANKEQLRHCGVREFWVKPVKPGLLRDLLPPPR